MAPLTVYKASAGSGKTFTLAVEYISLLILNPMDYEHILAVTFTNKATEEMKMRIISQLYGISKSLPDSRIYLNKVMEKTGNDRETVVRNAGIALKNLIHHYSYFRVQTIDAFFQTVFRNLARELDLPLNLRVDLDDNQIEERAVDELINSLDQNTDVLRWIREYIDQNINDDKSWNVIDKVKALGRNIFKDFYKQHSKELDEKMKSEKFFHTYTRSLHQKIDAIQSRLQSEAQQLLTLLQNSDYDDASFFKQGAKGVYGYVHKLETQSALDNKAPNSYVQGFLDDPESWVKSKDAASFAASELRPAVLSYEECRKKAWYDIQSAQLTLSHLNQLRLLHAIAATVEELCREDNRFQLSNTQTLLYELMKDSDAPFVYEKIGAHLRHIMIDEFQDTGRVQWVNFKKLLDNCMAMAGSHNLIVGDVKQSIYRWRSGDWKLLNDIANEFSVGQLKEEPLTVNHRSEELIVRFNNAFFHEAVAVTLQELTDDEIHDAQQLARAYQDEELEQQPFRQTGKGFVSVQLLPSKNDESVVMDEIGTIIDDLIARGADTRDIAILVRRHQEGERIANYLMTTRPQLTISSNEAFRLDSSQAVNILIDALQLLIKPEDTIVRAQLVKGYQRFALQSSLTDTDLLVCDHPEEFLPEGYRNYRNALIMMPFLDLIDELYRLFAISSIPHQSAYVCAFYDMIQQFMRERTPSVESFLKEWDNSLCSKTIQSDEAGGISIITLHKSKGLEFDHVLIPFCNWELERNDSILWCSGMTSAPYNELPLVPMVFSKSNMMGTAYEDNYKDEHLQNVVDNMNLLYVAFTRASKSLHILSPRMSDKRQKEGLKTQSRRGEILQWTLKKVAEELAQYQPIYEETTQADGTTIFQLGSLDHTLTKETDDKEKPDTENVFLKSVTPHPIRLESFATTASFRQSNRSMEFVSGEDSQPTRRLTYIKLGNVLHTLFSHIVTLDDIPAMMNELEMEGIVYDDELSREELSAKIQQALDNEQVKEWFSSKWTIYNECTIIEPDNSTGKTFEHRPDRVMSDGEQTIVVDFKFGVPRQEYEHQVQRYMQLLRQMGKPNVIGYLWYVLRNEVVRVQGGPPT